MVQVTEPLTALSPDVVSLFHTTDPHLGNLPIFAFHGPSTTGNSTLNSSRIQLHIFSAAGCKSYPRLTISPNSPFYDVVDQLPKEQQGDEIARGLAFGIFKYFKELPEVVKTNLIVQSAHIRPKKPGSAPILFGENHAANLAAAMVHVENITEVLQDLETAFQPQVVGHIDVDLVLPPGTIKPMQADEPLEGDNDDDQDTTLRMYGQYAPLVKLFGEVAFLPTSKLRRAPSKANSLNRSKSFLKAQKVSLRREMAELVDTEERYVMKMDELVHDIAQDFRSKAKGRPLGSASPSEQDMEQLFPQSLDKILALNTSFLVDIQKVMDDTDEEAMQDLETDQANYRASRYAGIGRARDPTGAVAFSKVLLEWFPKFTDCYQDYIRYSQGFPQIITGFLKQQSSFTQRVQQTGEQKLRSAVIEPVQRLPRYSLFIDNIVNYLPLSHPALQLILKARDIITDICALDAPAADKSTVVNRLKHVVDQWPSNLHPQGRLISAVDFFELEPPYDIASAPSNHSTGILLLFADTVIELRKARGSTLSARGLMAEVDKPSAAQMMASMTVGAGGQQSDYDVRLVAWHALSETRFTESNAGRVLCMTSLHGIKDGLVRDRNSTAADVHIYVLQGAYDGKAAKWTDEVTKARIEGRFSEKERESQTWCLRHVILPESGLHIYAAVFEEGLDTLIEGRKEPAPVRIVIDHARGTKGAPVGHYGVEIIANVRTSETSINDYKMEVDGLLDTVFLDSVDTNTFMPVLGRRVVELLRANHSCSNPALTAAFISYYSCILKGLNVDIPGERPKEKPRSFRRPASPVKMLSSFLNGNGSATSLVPNLLQKPARTPLPLHLSQTPTLLPSAMSRSGSTASESQFEAAPPSRDGYDDSRPVNQIVRLEETFTVYVAALQSRKGNVVGKNLRNRGGADTLQVNALYNSLIENPHDIRSSSEANFDVLFCAFEKYLKYAWKDQMGPVITLQTLQTLQEKNASLYPGDFAEFIKMVFSDMAPQNKRAFVAIIKLLADLLDGCGNDGDRGALTAAFAELLVPEGNAHDFINLLDRLIDDADRLFEDIGPGSSVGTITPNYGSTNSISRSNRSLNTGSLTSNASSLRKRFGLESILRQNSKNDGEARPSLWRTLSKVQHHGTPTESANSSISKNSTLGRSRSIDTGSGHSSPKRPMSHHERPTVLGAFDEHPSSSQVDLHSRLATIGASPPVEAVTKATKKKRRSSLSDLASIMSAAKLDSPLTSPLPSKRALPIPRNFKEVDYHTSPSTPTQKKSMMDRSIKYNRDPPSTKENSPSSVLSPRNLGSLSERNNNIMSPGDDSVETKSMPWTPGSVRSHRPSPSASSIPTLRGVLRDRVPSTPSTPPTRPRANSSMQSAKATPQKLRLQNPQKLRERLDRESQAISIAEASLQSELSKISEEMAKMNVTPILSRATAADIQALSANVKNLESRIPILIKDLTAKNALLKQDLATSLQASEYKVKSLDQLYKESSAENELLYEKFNGELGKIVKALRGKGKEDKEELVAKIRDGSEEVARVRKENAKLKRDVLTLRTLLKAYE